MKTVSVIVPVHNAAGTIEAAAHSALSQSYSDIELILVDDSSSAGKVGEADGAAEGAGEGSFAGRRGGDGSGDLCERIAREDPRVRVFHMEDRGVSAARNLGLDNAQGEFITFLDADDVLHPALVRTLLDLLEETGADYAGCGFERREGEAAPFAGTPVADSHAAGPVRGSGEAAGKVSRDAGCAFSSASGNGSAYGADSMECSSGVSAAAGPRSGQAAAGVTWLCGGQIITQGILHPERPDTRIWSKLFRREYIGEKRFREGLTIGEDFLFLAELAGETSRCVSIPAPLYSYYLNPRGAMERPFSRSHLDQITCWELAETAAQRRFPSLSADPDVTARFAARHLTAAVLTASKIARLPAQRQLLYETEFEYCRVRLRAYRGVKGAAQYLPAGYALKLRVLLHAPGLYRKLYR